MLAGFTTLFFSAAFWLMRACERARSGCRSVCTPAGFWPTAFSTRSRTSRTLALPWSGKDLLVGIVPLTIALAQLGARAQLVEICRRLAQLEPLRATRFAFLSAATAPSAPAMSSPTNISAQLAARKRRVFVPPFCAKCSEPFAGAITDAFTCANCAHRVLHFEAAVSAYRSRGIVRKLVHDFKYGRQIHLRHPLGRWLGETLDDPRLRGRRFDIIVPVPLHPARERERGFNQARVARRAAESRETRIPVQNVLAAHPLHHHPDRIRPRSERMENLRDAFRLRKNADVQDLRMLLSRRCPNDRLDPERMRRAS